MKPMDMEIAMSFHGHKCPAMPLGYRCGQAAMKALGVERAQDKELYCISETGKGHAAGCFLDGIMAITGCTYGKSNIEKKYYNKMAFILIDVADYEIPKGQGCFDTDVCSSCGERVFVNKLTDGVCVACREKEIKA